MQPARAVYGVFERSVPSDCPPVRVGKTRQNNHLGPGSDKIRTQKAARETWPIDRARKEPAGPSERGLRSSDKSRNALRDLKPNAFAARAEIAPDREPNSIRVGRDKPPANYSSATRNKKASAAAEVTPLNAFVARPLLDRRSLVRRKLACSHTVENLDSPQHDDDGQYQRSRRQYTF